MTRLQLTEYTVRRLHTDSCASTTGFIFIALLQSEIKQGTPFISSLSLSSCRHLESVQIGSMGCIISHWAHELGGQWFFFFLHENFRSCCFFKHSINIYIYTCMITHSYEHTHIHLTLMSTSERLSRLDLEIHEVGHQEYIAVNGTSSLTERIISREYNTHVKSKISTCVS
jgi:hypothetical protein